MNAIDFVFVKHLTEIKLLSTLEEFCQIYPELLAQAREYAEGTIVDPEEHNDAVESCICDFVEGARAAIYFKTNPPARS